MGRGQDSNPSRACQSESNSEAWDPHAVGVGQKKKQELLPLRVLIPRFCVALHFKVPSPLHRLCRSPAWVDFSRSPRCHPTLNKSLLSRPRIPTPAFFFGACPLLFISTGAAQECSEADLIATCSASPPLPPARALVTRRPRAPPGKREGAQAGEVGRPGRSADPDRANSLGAGEPGGPPSSAPSGGGRSALGSPGSRVLSSYALDTHPPPPPPHTHTPRGV